MTKIHRDQRLGHVIRLCTSLVYLNTAAMLSQSFKNLFEKQIKKALNTSEE